MLKREKSKEIKEAKPRKSLKGGEEIKNRRFSTRDDDK